MNQNDDGYFHYNDEYPPLCIRPPTHQQPDFDSAMNRAIIDYLQDSYKNGLKDADTILDSGLSAGEAAVLYFRLVNNKRKPRHQLKFDIEEVIKKTMQSIETHMGFDVHAYIPEFEKHINPSLFQSKQYKRKFLPAIKAFLDDTNMKTKGYTHRLKKVMQDMSHALAL